jgi:hypothetical protein
MSYYDFREIALLLLEELRADGLCGKIIIPKKNIEENKGSHH